MADSKNVDLTQCALVKMTNMPFGAEPAWVYLHHINSDSRVKEIVEANGAIYCYVDTLVNAHSFAVEYDGRSALHKYPHQFKKVTDVKVVSMTEAPDPEDVQLRLSDFLRTKENMPKTKTVQFRGLPRGHTTRAIGNMCEEAFENWYSYVDDECGHFNYPAIDPDPRAEYIDASYGEGIVRFSSWLAARQVVDKYNGDYYNDGTVYVEFVDDSELDEVVAQQQQNRGTTVGLFVSGIKPGTSSEDLRNLFLPHVLKDVQMPPGGKNFAFVFLHKDAAAKFMNDYPNGKRYGGWKYYLKYADKKGRGKSNARPKTTIPISTVNSFSDVDTLASTVGGMAVSGPTDSNTTDVGGPVTAPTPIFGTVRISGFFSNTTEQQIRDFCANYGVTPGEIQVHQGQATIKIAGLMETENAALILNQKKIPGQKKKVIAAMVD